MQNAKLNVVRFNNDVIATSNPFQLVLGGVSDGTAGNLSVSASDGVNSLTFAGPKDYWFDDPSLPTEKEYKSAFIYISQSLYKFDIGSATYVYSSANDTVGQTLGTLFASDKGTATDLIQYNGTYKWIGSRLTKQ